MKVIRWMVGAEDALHERPAPTVVCLLECDGRLVDGPVVSEGWVGHRFVNAGEPVPLDGIVALGSLNAPNPQPPTGQPDLRSFSAADFGRGDRLPDVKTFVSYRREDALIGAHWAARLLDRGLGSGTFVAPTSITVGVDFSECIHDALARAKVLVAMIGPDWETHTRMGRGRSIDSEWDWVRIEVRSALDRGIPVIPVLVDRTSFPTPDSLPDDLRPVLLKQGVAIRGDHFEADCADLVLKIRGLTGA